MAASYLTIVSGLPRSGTSMMMQVLCAGGLAPLADHQRQADEDNPRGYYEFEAVKRTRQDPTWLMASHGKVVKIAGWLKESNSGKWYSLHVEDDQRQQHGSRDEYSQTQTPDENEIPF